MSVVLHLNDARVERLDWRLESGTPFTVALPERAIALSPKVWQLCFITANEPLAAQDVVQDLPPSSRYVVAIGRIRGSGRYSTTDDRIKVSDTVIPSAAIQVEVLTSGIPAEVQEEATVLLRSDAASPNVDISTAIVEHLVQIRPEIHDAVRRLQAMDAKSSPIEGSVGEILALERDAVHLAMSIAGLDPESLTDWESEGDPQSFIPNLKYQARPDDFDVGNHPSVDDVGEPAFQGAHGFHWCLAGSEFAPVVAAPLGVAPKLDDGHDVQDPVDAPVPGPGKAVPVLVA